jgi:hypothetical protein
MSGLAVSQVATAINRIATKTSVRLESWIQRFCLERFLYDYLGDEKLLWRVNQVMNRVGLQAVPEEMVDWLPGARRDVTARAADLLTKNRND